MTGARIRAAGRTDAARFDAALARPSAELGDIHRATPEMPEPAEFGAEPAFRALLAEAGETPAGVAVYAPAFSTTRGMAGLTVSELWVPPERREERLGRRLPARAARDAAGRWQAGFLRLAVYRDNSTAQGLYERLGLAEARHERSLVLDRPGFDLLGNEA